MHSPDILIVGAGIAGTSLAWHLAGNAEVTVLEQGDQHCAEASAQNAGILMRVESSAFARDLACRSYDLLHDLPSDDWEVAPFQATGGIYARLSESPALDATFDDLRRRGVRAQAYFSTPAESSMSPIRPGW